MPHWLLAALLCWPMLAAAQAPITMISPFPNPGGGSGRLFAEALGRELGQPVVLLQREGAAGLVGMRALAGAAPDGLTIAYTAMTPLVVQPHLVRDLGYRPEAVPAICNVAENMLGLIVRTDSPFRTLADIVAASRRQSVTYGTAGTNSLPHLGMQRLQAATGADLTHVPHRGDPLAVTETYAGRIDLAAVSVAAGAAMVANGDLRIIAMLGRIRHPEYPAVPTLTEQGVEVVQQSFAGLYAPPGTPQAVLDRYETACRRAADDPGYRRSAQVSGVVVTVMGGHELTALVTEERARAGDALRAMGVQPQ